MIQDSSWLTKPERYLDEDRSEDSLQCHIQISFLPTIVQAFCLSHTADVLYCSSFFLLKFFLICTQSEQLSGTCQTYGAIGLQGKFLTNPQDAQLQVFGTLLAHCYGIIRNCAYPRHIQLHNGLEPQNSSCACYLNKKGSFLPFRQLFQQYEGLFQFGSQSKKIMFFRFVLQ